MHAATGYSVIIHKIKDGLQPDTAVLAKIASQLWPGGARNRLTDLDESLHVGRDSDVINCANFGDHQLRSLGMAWGQFLVFCLDIRRRPCKHFSTGEC